MEIFSACAARSVARLPKIGKMIAWMCLDVLHAADYSDHMSSGSANRCRALSLKLQWKPLALARYFFSIGTSGIVQPAATLAYAAHNRGAVIVEINAEPTPLTPKVDFFFQGKSGEILPELVNAIWAKNFKSV